ncbi:MAG TPA: hypothetical protein VN249_02690 [Prolixibacteraceae bacterium]|nr:hypothetical protein [Prolixibacteraceae bacterium]
MNGFCGIKVCIWLAMGVAQFLAIFTGFTPLCHFLLPDEERLTADFQIMGFD